MESSIHLFFTTSLKNNLLVELCIIFFLQHKSQCLDVTYHVEEQKNAGTYIGNIAADTQLLDSVLFQDHRLITFSHLQRNKGRSSEMFNVSKTGELYTAQRLDAETICKYNTECFRMVDVAVRNKESFIKILEIKVIIDDINDHQPEFPVKQVNLQFDEGDRKGMIKFIPNAIDKDVGVLNSQITYQLKKNIDEPFKLSVSKKVDGSAKLGIVLDKSLDREVKDIYKLQVSAKDGGTPPKQGVINVQITVADLNDNPPVFSENIYNVSLENTYQIDTPIVTVSATDFDSGKNGRFLFHINSKTSDLAKTYFKLNQETGKIFLSKKFPFDKRQTYKLFIEATDSGVPPLSSTAIVLINMINQQNNAPSIDVNFFSESTGDTVTISEGIKVGSFIAYVKVNDNDIGQNGEVTCDLHHDKLQLQSLGRKKYKVVIKNPVDREIERYIDFTITCKDKGSPPLQTESKFSVQVMDINDVRPQFTKDTFRFLTYENEKINFPVGFINATDQDQGPGGQLTFSLMGNNNHVFPFQISNFGFILTTESLDREEQEIYKFKVLVKDNGIPPLNNTANVVVEVMDENDNAPYFTFPSVSPFSLDVHYHPQSKKNITVLKASDRDSYENAFLRYEILRGNDKQLFTVNPYSGMLSFSRTVYQNDAGSYNLQFVVKDSGTPVLSATTTLSLILTVSNKTTKMLTTVYSKSDKKIHINLFIIILVAILIVSIAIVISITMCIVRKNNQRTVNYSTNSEFVDESRQLKFYTDEMAPQNGVPVTISDMGKYEKPQLTELKGESHSGYESSLNRKVSASGIHCQATTEGTQPMYIQKIVVTPDGRKYKETAFNAPCRYSELSGVPYADRRQNVMNKRGTGHYEELSGQKVFKPDEFQNTIGKSLPRTLSRPKDTNTSTTRPPCQQPSVGQNTPCNDVIDLKSIPDGHTGIPSQLWNLPMRNSFTSNSKPLPAVPKIPPS